MVMKRVTALILVTILATPVTAMAQEPQAVDASKMGVSLSRIKRELVQAQAEDQDPNALKLTFTVEVVGTAPKINLLEGFAVSGAVPYGPPTHQEVLDVLTPREFRSPVFPIYGLAMVAAQKLWEYNKKRQCEAEIAEYRQLVMSGVAVAAPRCTQ